MRMSDQPGHHDWLGDGASDAHVVEALRRGEEAAFVALVERYHRPLVRLARAYVHEEAIAEDVAQDAWLAFLQSLSRFAGRSSLKTWLFRILVNCARARSRRERHSIPFSDAGLDDEDRPSVDPSRFLPPGQRWAAHWADPPASWHEEHALEGEVIDVLQHAIAILPPSQRAVLTLRDIEGWTCPEVCDVLGISEGNQRVLLHRARTRIRAEMEHYFADRVEGAQS